jgi:Pathogenicity locus
MVRTSELRAIPGVGPSIAIDLEELGIRKVAQLKGRSPEAMYEALCERRGHQDRCLLYVFRGAVYFASRKRHDPELLKWWNWSDAAIARRSRARAR